MTDQIPGDVMSIARNIAYEAAKKRRAAQVEIIARALMAERQRLDIALSVNANLMGLIINVRSWVNNGYVETATKHIDDMTADAWAKSGWKAFCETGRTAATHKDGA